ncbi:MAG TPA: hypothetical protein VGA92_05180 [Candidatus Nitrosotenuis sp.]|jgi:fido (protein-threonine AMPylation protein)
MKRLETQHVEDIISWNKKETNERKESFGVKLEVLNGIVDKVNLLSDILDDKERVLRQMSTLIGLIVFEQPFNNGNKATATSSAIQFLRTDGYELDLESEKAQDELLQMLDSIMYLFEDQSEQGIIAVRKFLEKHLK